MNQSMTPSVIVTCCHLLAVLDLHLIFPCHVSLYSIWLHFICRSVTTEELHVLTIWLGLEWGLGLGLVGCNSALLFLITIVSTWNM